MKNDMADWEKRVEYLVLECNEFVHNNSFFRELIFEHQHYIRSERGRIIDEITDEITSLLMKGEIEDRKEIDHQYQDRYVVKVLDVLDKLGVEVSYE